MAVVVGLRDPEGHQQYRTEDEQYVALSPTNQTPKVITHSPFKSGVAFLNGLAWLIVFAWIVRREALMEAITQVVQWPALIQIHVTTQIQTLFICCRHEMGWGWD